MSDKQEEVFQYMLQEHQVYHGMFDRHYSAVERAVSFYFVLIAGVMSLNGFMIKDGSSFSMFRLTDLQLFSCFFLGCFGVVVIFNVLEHRLLQLKYVKNANMNRKWFHDRFPNEKLGGYTLWPVGGQSPRLYVKFRPFWWEMLGLSIVASFFLGLFIVDVVRELGYTSPYYRHINGVGLALTTVALAMILMYGYRRRSESLEGEVAERMAGPVATTTTEQPAGPNS